MIFVDRFRSLIDVVYIRMIVLIELFDRFKFVNRCSAPKLTIYVIKLCERSKLINEVKLSKNYILAILF